MPRGRGYTKVDLRHLLEDLRDAYPGSLEELFRGPNRERAYDMTYAAA